MNKVFAGYLDIIKKDISRHIKLPYDIYEHFSWHIFEVENENVAYIFIPFAGVRSDVIVYMNGVHSFNTKRTDELIEMVENKKIPA